MTEVDHFWDWMEPRLAALGYASAYLKKPSGSDGKGGQRWHEKQLLHLPARLLSCAATTHLMCGLCLCVQAPRPSRGAAR